MNIAAFISDGSFINTDYYKQMCIIFIHGFRIGLEKVNACIK